MTNNELKEKILAKIAEIEKKHDRLSFLEEEAYRNGEYPDLDAYLAMYKEYNYAKGAALRLIKRLLVSIYGEWPFSENYDYLQAMIDFRRFC